MTPTISILIANYNYEAYVGGAIESALAQTWPAVEVIVVDDGSKDGSRAVIERYPTVRAIFQENRGHCAAARRGLEAATGDLVIFLDADDLLVPQTCERVAALWQEGLHGLQFRLEIFGAVDKVGETLPRYPFDRGDIQRRFLDTGSLVYSPTSGNAFDRDFALRVFALSQGLEKSSFDVWLGFAAAATGRLASSDEVLGRYRIHATNMSQPGRQRVMSNILLDIWYAWNAQQSAFAVARSYGIPVECPPHLVGAYYLKWYFLLRGATSRWTSPPVPVVAGVLTGLANFRKLTSIGPMRRLANMLTLVMIAASPRPLRRLIAERWYGYINDVGF